jgi:hypothetical protein
MALTQLELFDGIRLEGSGALMRAEECIEYLKEIPDHIELRSTLKVALDSLRRLGDPRLYYDFKSKSFMFEAGGFKGGLIFHDDFGWRLHT